jgi:hypothetical protein
MPYWNRPRELTKSLAAYAKVYPGLSLEFSICDDGSIPPLEARPGCKITRLPQKSYALNPCVPINVAVRASTHDVIVLTNPEIEHREPVLLQMLEALKGENDYAMAACHDTQIGPIAGEGTPYGTAGRKPIPPGSDLHFCVMFYRSLFERVGGFDEAYRNGLGCDDNDWVWRLYTSGVNFKRVPGVVWHTRTPHRWKGTLEKNAALLESKWGHLEEYRKCA